VGGKKGSIMTQTPTDRMTLILHSGDFDKAMSSLILGNGALAMGMDVTIFATFWGLERFMRGGLERGKLSSRRLLGLGKCMIRRRMRKARVASLERLLADYKELGGRVIACEMTMEIMGIGRNALRDDVIDEYGAVGTYIQQARESSITLFI